MERLHRIQADLSHHDSAQRFQSLGVDVFFGHGTFTSPQEVTVNQHTLRFRKAVIATGTRAAIPPIPGLDTVGYLTHATLFSFLFSLKACPPHLGVIGGGPVGCELAQALQRLGAQVTLLHHHPRLLNREDGEAAAIIQHSLESDGVNVLLNAQVEQVQGEANPFMGKKVLYYRQGTQSHHLTVDALLISTGRLPNVENLNLAAAGVKYSTQGITVNDYLQTTNPKIYAAGDVCLAQRFTHAADGAARLVLKNALFSPWGLGRSRWSQVVVPHCLYTSPELAQVGLTAAEAAAQGIALRTFEIPLSQVDRAITVGTISETALGTISGTTAGFAKIHVRQGSDQILGATVVAEQAGELISEITLAMVHRIGLGSLANVLHPYPTHSEIIRKAADAYRRTLLTPRTLGLLKALMRWG
jgi:pyruvate/2-oxoglutarate dehydrogenase complex dihydrolipoamide dehydrogenase (E3) component